MRHAATVSQLARGVRFARNKATAADWRHPDALGCFDVALRMRIATLLTGDLFPPVVFAAFAKLIGDMIAAQANGDAAALAALTAQMTSEITRFATRSA